MHTPNEFAVAASRGTASLSSLLTRFEQAQRSQQLAAAGSAVVTVAAIAARVRPLEVAPAMLVLCTGLAVAGVWTPCGVCSRNGSCTQPGC